ncbi:hypothetical protein [Bradyrhizobium sp.]|uniref:hypothetical protein n=1 Tax=Bradyrhizobium sp. TaxID=376 RepID=UPI003C6A076B
MNWLHDTWLHDTWLHDTWLHDLAYLFGGAFLANAVPHFVSGVMGRPFQSPFATPPGQGLSSSTVNVLWGFFNLVVGYLLICRVGDFDLRSTEHVVACGLGILLLALPMARRFGRFNGGNPPFDKTEAR